jgi:hypothetical protein
MKKKYFLLLAHVVLVAFCTKAQLTLTKATSEPVAGDTYTNVAHDTNGVVPRNTGANQVWNFTATSKSTSSNAEIAFSYSNAAAISGATAYPGCNLVEVGASGVNTYYRTSASQYELMGQSGGNFNFTFTNTAIVANWPIAYGYNNTDVFAGSLVSGTTTANASGNLTVAASGTGTLQLPEGITLSNVLQLKVDQRITAPVTIPGFPIPVTVTINITNFQYYHSSDKFPVANLTTQKISLPIGSPTVTSNMFINAKQVPIGIKENVLNSNNISLYPNPSKNTLFVTLNGISAAAELEVYNVTGALVQRVNKASIENELNISELTSGMYYLKLSTTRGAVTKKFIKE